MLVEGECLRLNFRDLESDKIAYPNEIDVHVGGPSEGTTGIGTAQLSEHDDGIWAVFVISDLDTKLLEANKYFAVELTETENNELLVTHLGLTTSNLDPDIKPVQTS